MGTQKITLTTSDGVDITVDRHIAERSIVIRNLIEDYGSYSGEAIPIYNANERVMRMVIEWCEQHKDDDFDPCKDALYIDGWDQEFIQADPKMLIEIILAANYLDIKSLLDIGCKTVANMIKGKSPDEIRKTFDIQDDFTQEEMAQIDRERGWADYEHHPHTRSRFFMIEGFHSLPLELHIMIFERLGSEVDMMAFVHTNASLYGLLRPRLYEHNAQYTKSSALLWAVTKQEREIIEYALRNGANPGADGVLEAAVLSMGCAGDIMKLLLYGRETMVTDRVLEAAARNKSNGYDLMAVILEERPETTITERVFRAATNNKSSGNKIMQLFVENSSCIEITENVLKNTAKQDRRCVVDLMRVLLKKSSGVTITESVLITAARNRSFGDKLMRVVLEERPGIAVTVGVLEAAQQNVKSGESILRYIFGRPEMMTTLEAAAGNEHSMERIIQTFPIESAETKIVEGSETMIMEGLLEFVFGNSLCGEWVIQTLLKKNPDVTITERVLSLTINTIYRDENDPTPLLLAGRYGYPKIVDEFRSRMGVYAGAPVEGSSEFKRRREPARFDFLRWFLERFEAPFEQAPQLLEEALGMEMAIDWDDVRFQDLVEVLVLRYSGGKITQKVCIEMIVRLFIYVPSYWKVYGDYPLRPPRFLERDTKTPHWYPNSEYDRDLRVNFEAFYSDPRRTNRGIDHPGPGFAKALTRAIRAAFMRSELTEEAFVRPASEEFEDEDLDPIFQAGEERVVALEKMHARLAAQSIASRYSQTDVPVVHSDLQFGRLGSGKNLEWRLSLSIVSIGHIRIVKRRRLEQLYRANEFLRREPSATVPGLHQASVAGLYLSIKCVSNTGSGLGLARVVPQRILFQATARDQGWVSLGGEGIYGSRGAFIEASILRPNGRRPNTDRGLEELFPDIWETPLHASDALEEKGWDFVSRDDGRKTWKVCNNARAGKDYSQHSVEWRRGCTETGEGGEGGEGFVELLEPGCVVVLWARAVERGGESRVRTAAIEIEYEVQ